MPDSSLIFEELIQKYIQFLKVCEEKMDPIMDEVRKVGRFNFTERKILLEKHGWWLNEWNITQRIISELRNQQILQIQNEMK